MRIRNASPRAVISALACALCVSVLGNAALGILAAHRRTAEAAEQAALLFADLLALSEAETETDAAVYAALAETRLPAILASGERRAFTQALHEPSLRPLFLELLGERLIHQAESGLPEAAALRDLLVAATKAISEYEKQVTGVPEDISPASAVYRDVFPLEAAEKFCGVKYVFREAASAQADEHAVYCRNLYLCFGADGKTVTSFSAEHFCGGSRTLDCAEAALNAEKFLCDRLGYSAPQLVKTLEVGDICLLSFTSEDGDGEIGISRSTGYVCCFRAGNKIHRNVLQ